MRTIALPFAALAMLGLVLSAYVHVSALAGVEPDLPFDPMFMHGGVFVVFIPAVLSSRRVFPNSSGDLSWPELSKRLPRSAAVLIVALIAYAFVNFFLTFFLKVGPEVTATLRGFSGHWMLFFGASAALHYVYWRYGDGGIASQCPNGHALGPGASFCRKCGVSIPKGDSESADA